MVIDNYPEGQVEEMEAVNNPEDAAMGTRKVPFSRVLYIEQDDFREDPAQAVFPPLARPRSAPALRLFHHLHRRGEGRKTGEVLEVHCTYDPATRGGDAPDGRKVKSTIHWVSAAHAIDAEVRLYDNLFTKENPGEVAEGQDFTANLNPHSLEIVARLQAGAVACATPRPAPATSSSAWATSASIPAFAARRAGLQPHRGAARHLGQNRKAGKRGAE